MTFLRTLKTRIVVGFIVFGLILSVTLAVAVYLGLQRIEDFVIENAMEAELAEAGPTVAGLQAPLAVMEIYSGSRSDGQNVPVYLQTLSPGYHRIVHDGRRYAVLVQEREGHRYIASYDEGQIIRRDRYWVTGLAIGVVLACTVSMWIGYSLSGQVIRPVRQLTSDVRALESGREVGGELDGYANDEIGSLADAFRNYRERFQALVEREREFSSNVSHELRTPVTSINLAVEVLADDPTMTDKQRFRLDRIRRAGHEMSELINTFLLLSRQDEDSLDERVDCDVNQTVRDTVANQRVWIEDKPVSVRIIEDAQLTVPAPPGVIAVLIGNVIRNAYRYTKKGLVTVRVCADRVIIDDTGPGIDAGTQAHLFDRHVHGASGDHGTGLGLSIVKRICERFGWQVEFASTPGAGSRFEIVLHPATATG